MMSRLSNCGWALSAAALAGGLLAAPAAAHAQLIAADSYLVGFNPAVGEYFEDRLNAGGGQNPTITPGWTGNGSAAWSVGTANMNVTTITLQNSAITYEAGGKARYEGSPTDAYRAGHHKMDTYTPSNTYYMSMLLNPGGSFLSGANASEHALVGFTNFFTEASFEDVAGGTDEPAVFGLLAGFTGNIANNTVDLILRARDITTGELADTVMLADGVPNGAVSNITHHVLLKMEINVGGGVGDQVTYWVNPTNLTDEASLTATAQATGSVTTAAMDLNNRIDRLFALTNNWDRSSFFWDETRFGKDLYSVLGVTPPAIPGDLNGDGYVDLVDVQVVGLNWMNTGPPGPPNIPGDANGDGIVNLVDVQVVGLNWHMGTPPGGPASASGVPEPSTLVLAVPVLLGLSVGGWRRSRAARRS